MEQSRYQKWPSLSTLGEYCRRWNHTTTSSPKATPKASFQIASWSTNSWAPWDKQNHWPNPAKVLLVQLFRRYPKMVPQLWFMCIQKRAIAQNQSTNGAIQCWLAYGAHSPWHSWPLPLSESGNQYLLIVADYFTKWPEAYPLPNQMATTVAEVLSMKWFVDLGYPLKFTPTKVTILKVHCSKKCVAYWAWQRPEQLHYTHSLMGW